MAASYRKLLSVLAVLVVVQGSTSYSLRYHAPGLCSKLSEPVYHYHQEQEEPELNVLPSTVYFYDCEGPPQTKPGFQLMFGCHFEGPRYSGCQEKYQEYEEHQNQNQKFPRCDLDWAAYRKAYQPFIRAASGHSGAY